MDNAANNNTSTEAVLQQTVRCYDPQDDRQTQVQIEEGRGRLCVGTSKLCAHTQDDNTPAQQHLLNPTFMYGTAPYARCMVFNTQARAHTHTHMN